MLDSDGNRDADPVFANRINLRTAPSLGTFVEMSGMAVSLSNNYSTAFRVEFQLDVIDRAQSETYAEQLTCRYAPT